MCFLRAFRFVATGMSQSSVSASVPLWSCRDVPIPDFWGMERKGRIVAVENHGNSYQDYRSNSAARIIGTTERYLRRREDKPRTKVQPCYTCLQGLAWAYSLI